MSEMILCRCFLCKRIFSADLMVPVEIKEPKEESYISVKRYLCPNCNERLNQFKWIQEQELEKDNQKMKGGGTNDKNEERGNGTK